jgi:hypothetical protein
VESDLAEFAHLSRFERILCKHALEHDQRCVKHCGHSGLGVRAFHTAQRTIQGYEAMPMIRKGQLVGIDKRDVLHLLGLAETLERVVGVSPEALRQRTVEALWQLSLQGSRRQPLILTIEDVQGSVANFERRCRRSYRGVIRLPGSRTGWPL